MEGLEGLTQSRGRKCKLKSSYLKNPNQSNQPKTFKTNRSWLLGVEWKERAGTMLEKGVKDSLHPLSKTRRHTWTSWIWSQVNNMAWTFILSHYGSTLRTGLFTLWNTFQIRVFSVYFLCVKWGHLILTSAFWRWNTSLEFLSILTITRNCQRKPLLIS